MKAVAEYTELSVPDYALSYLVNGDSSGLEDGDKEIIDEWYAQFVQEAQENNGYAEFVCDSDGDSFFTWSPEFGLACSCYECAVYILVAGDESGDDLEDGDEVGTSE